MKSTKSLLLIVAAIISATACGNETTAPKAATTPAAGAASSSLGLIPLLTGVTSHVVSAQTWLVPVRNPVAVSVNVTPSQGGLLTIPLLGVVVTIPAGAVNAPTTITMTALPGRVVALDFQPAGTRFNKPLHVAQNMLLTNWIGQSFDFVYFKATSDINNTSATINASEVIPVSMLGPIANFDIWHFSGYAASGGRASLGEE